MTVTVTHEHIRRGEKEVLVLDKARVRFVRTIAIATADQGLLTLLEFDLMGKTRLLCDFVKLAPSRTPDGRVCLLYRDAGLRLRKSETLPDGDKPGVIEYRLDGNDTVYSFEAGRTSSEIRAVTEALLVAIRADPEASRVLDERPAVRAKGATE